MKKLIFCFLVLLIASSAFASSFCSGFEDGYEEGYCYGKSFCLSPITPICPIPSIGDNSYSDGYNEGFLEGLNDQ